MVDYGNIVQKEYSGTIHNVQNCHPFQRMNIVSYCFFEIHTTTLYRYSPLTLEVTTMLTAIIVKLVDTFHSVNDEMTNVINFNQVNWLDVENTYLTQECEYQN